MTRLRFYGYGLPGMESQALTSTSDPGSKSPRLPGRLVVLEGTDGVGRSTQVALLREWLESSGYAVISSGLKRSSLAGKGMENVNLPGGKSSPNIAIDTECTHGPPRLG